MGGRPASRSLQFDRAGGKVVDVGPLGRNVGPAEVLRGCQAALTCDQHIVLIDRDRVDEAEAKMDSAGDFDIDEFAALPPFSEDSYFVDGESEDTCLSLPAPC